MNLICVLNGPNLNSMGKRQPDIYGSKTLDDVAAEMRTLAAEFGHETRFQQSNREYELVDWIHAARDEASAIVIDTAAFTHTSVAVLDALNGFEGVAIEIRISNVHRRESFRHRSYVSLRADGFVVGMGTDGYPLALRGAAMKLAAGGGLQ